MRPAGGAARVVAALALGIGSAGIAPGAVDAAPVGGSASLGPPAVSPPASSPPPVVYAADDRGGGLTSATVGEPSTSRDVEAESANPRFVAVADDTVFYTESGAHGGVYASGDGGRTRIAALPMATGVGLDGATLYAVTRDGVLHTYPDATGPGTATRLNVPATANIQGMAIDGGDDGTVYLADWADRVVYAAHPGAPGVRIVAGPVDGLERPVDVVTDSGGVYVTELDAAGGRTGRVSRIGPGGRTTLAGGLDIPTGLALVGGVLYVAEGGADRICVVDTDTGATRPVVTEGLDGPWGIAVRAPGAGSEQPDPLGWLAQAVGLVR